MNNTSRKEITQRISKARYQRRKKLHDDAIELLTDIYKHISGGAPLYEGSLIFKEDKPADEVIKDLLERANVKH